MKIPNIPTQALIIAFLIRLLITGATFGDAQALACLVVLLCFEKHLDSKRVEDPTKELREKIAAVESKIDNGLTKVNAFMAFRGGK